MSEWVRSRTVHLHVQVQMQFRWIIAAAAIAAAASCSSAPPSSPPPPGAPTIAAAQSSPSASCKLTTTFDYIVRDSDPGASIQASEIGNVDIVNCADSLSTFAATAGQAPGECTTIAKASDNPGYDVNAVPAPPLKDVIESAGPGC